MTELLLTLCLIGVVLVLVLCLITAVMVYVVLSRQRDIVDNQCRLNDVMHCINDVQIRQINETMEKLPKHRTMFG